MNCKKALLIVVVTFLITSLILAIMQPGLIREALSMASLSDAKYQQVDYATNERGTFINAPLDSRPIGREYIQNLAVTAGYNYVEISSGLDYANGDNSYRAGNPTTVQTSLANTVRVNNYTDTTVVINTSSYFHGGLIANRMLSSYANMDQKMSSLKNLLSSYTRPTYYVIMQVPRTIPDTRVLAFPSGITATSKVDGLEAYYNKANKKTGGQVTFEQALLDWTYLYYSQKAGNTLPQDAYVRNFYNDFYGKYKAYLDSYLGVFEQSYAYLNQLYIMKNQNYKFNLVISADYYVTSNFINSHAGKSGFAWIKKDATGKAIPYCGTRYVADFAEIYSNFGPVVSGTETTTYLVLAADLMKRNGTGVDFITRDPSTNGGLNGLVPQAQGYYDRKNTKDLLDEKTEYINRYVRNTNLAVNFYVFNSGVTTNIQPDYANLMVSNVYQRMETQEDYPAAMVDLSGKFDETVFNAFLRNSNRNHSIYDLVYCGGIYSAAGSLDMALAASSVAAVLNADLAKTNGSNTFTRNRINSYNKTKLITVSGDIVYNNKIRPQSNFNSSLNNRVIYSNGAQNSGTNLMNLFTSKTYHIGNLDYSYTGASISASSPWNRAFEVKLIPNLSGLRVDQEQTDIPVTSISLNRSNLNVTSADIGYTYQLSATVSPSNATNKNVYWESSRPSVATVNGNGLVTYRGVGTTTITASTDNGKSATCRVTVEREQDRIPVTSVSLNTTRLDVTSADIGYTYQLRATITPSNATTKDIYWESSNPSVATVNGNGLVTYRGVGSATITASSNNGKYATCRVTITKEVIEQTKPEISVDNYTTTWTNQDILITMTVTDSKSAISLVTINGQRVTSSSNRYQFRAQTNGTYTIEAKNAQGNTTTKVITINNIDKTLPTINISGDNQVYAGSTITVGIQAFDDDSKIKSVTVNGKEMATGNGSFTYPVNAAGRYTVIATDNAGNSRTTYFTIAEKEQEKDVTPPTLTVTGAPTSWTNQDVVLTIQATDAGSGVKTVTVNGKEISIQNGIGRYTVTKNGTYEFVATDNAGNTTTYRLQVSMINKTSPTIANVQNNHTYDGPVRPQIGASVSGIKSVVLKKNGNIVPNYQMGTTISEDGNYELSITDLAGNTTTIYFTIKNKATNPGNDDNKPGNNTNTNNNGNTNTNTNTNNNGNTNTNTGNNTNTDNNNTNTDNNNTNTNTNTNNNNSNTNTNTNNNSNTNTNNDSSNSGVNGNTNLNINSGNKNTGSTNTNIGGNNKPTSTTGNLDTTKTTGRIPQTGDVSIVDIILVAGCMLLIPTGIVTFKRYRKISK